MTTRSLVGMTQGARKRAARRDAVTANPSGGGMWRHESDFARSLVCFRGSELVTIADVGPRACDGSSVLPAKRRK